MKRILFGLLVALLLVVLIVPAMVPDQTAPTTVVECEPRIHCMCGQTTSGYDSCSHCNTCPQTWQPWTDSALPVTAGYWYLVNDVEITRDLTITGGDSLNRNEISIDLNGKTVTVKNAKRIFDLASQHITLNLTDTSANKTGILDYSGVTGTENFGYGIRMNAANTTVNMYGGTITGAKFAGTGGAGVLLGSSSSPDTTVFHMYGGSIMNGVGGKGGNVFIHHGKFYLHNGTISGGTATEYGGNIFVNSLAEKSTSAHLHIEGGTVCGGSAASGTSIYAHRYAEITVSGGEITGASKGTHTGAVHIAENATLSVSGSAKIYGNQGANVYLPAGKTIISGGNLSGDARIGVTLADYTDLTSDSRGVITSTQSSYFHSDNSDYKVKMAGSALVLTRVADFKFNGMGKLKDFDDCVNEAVLAKKDFVQLQVDVASLNITGDTYLDLNGHVVGTVHIHAGATLYAFDSATKNYDAANRGYIQAKTGEGSIATAFVNSELHRYLTLQEANGYSFHRFYLAVTDTGMSGDFGGMRYKATLKCNDVVANALNNGGDFGINLYVGSAAVPASNSNMDWSFGTTVHSGETFGVLETFSANAEEVKAYMNVTQACNAYIKIGDTKITSSQKSCSMKQMILSVVNNRWDTEMDVLQRNLLAEVYREYGQIAQMDSWDAAITNKLKPAAGPVEKWDCICGDKAATGTPCANAGHLTVEWKDLSGTTLPTTTGYYRLTANMNVTDQAAILANNHVVIDLNGYTITQTKADTRLFVLNASNAQLTITDHTGGGMVIPVGKNNMWGMIVNMDAGSAQFDMYGGILNVTGIPSQYGTAIVNNGTTNLYGGAITGGNSVNGGGSVMVYNGTFNQYGGIIENGTSENAGGEYFGGGNVRVSSTGTFCIYGGTVRNGNSVGPGGNIHNQGVVNLYGGTVIGGSTASKGGGIFMNGSAITVSGTPEVAGNEVSDIYLASDKKIDIAGTGLKDGASIGVYASHFTGAFTTTANATAANGKYFFSNLDKNCTSQVRDGALVMGYEGYCIGYAAANINPEPAMYGQVGVMGYSNESTRLVERADEENPVKAICLAVADGKGGIAVLVSVDTACITNYVSQKITKNIVNKYGIPEQSIMFSCNQQHSTPVFHKGYDTLTIARITAAIEESIADMKPVTAMDVQTVDVGANRFNFVRNLQYLDANGDPIPGAMATDNHDDALRLNGQNAGVDYESIADSSVQLLRIRRTGQQDIMLVNFQTHPVLYTSDTSRIVHADIAGKFRNALEASTGCKAMYFTGASANIKPYSNYESGKQFGYLAVFDQGANMAAAVIAGMNAGTWESAMGTGESVVRTITATHSYGVNTNIDDMPQWYIDANPGKTVEELAALRLQRALQICPEGNNNFVSNWTSDDVTRYAIYSKYHAKHMVLRSKYTTDTLNRDISAIAFGDVAFAVASYEMFDTNGMQIKDGSPYKMTFVTTMAYMPHTTKVPNGELARYIPSALAYANGGYSTDITHYASGTGEKLVANFVEMLKALKAN